MRESADFSGIGVFSMFCDVFCALANALQPSKTSVVSKFCARKQRKNGIRGTESEFQVARGSVGAEAPPPPRAQPKSQFEFFTARLVNPTNLSCSIWWVSGIQHFE